MIRYPLCSLLFLCVLVGCAPKTQTEVRLLWPIPPDGPRFEFTGSYRAIGDMPHNFMSRWFEILTGKSEDAPVLRQPRGVLVLDERIYVADEGHRNIMVFDFSARSIAPLFNNGVLDTPFDITVDHKGNLYVADAERHKVLVFTPDGTFLRSFGSAASLKRPAHLLINHDNNRLYVADIEQHCIVAFDLTGGLLFTFGREGTDRGEFRLPRGMAFDPEGRLFVADSGNARIQVFDPNGRYLEQFGLRGNTVHYFLEPMDLAFDSEGNLHILDGGLRAMLSYNLKRKVLLATGSGAKSKAPMGLANPAALYIDTADRIFIADSVNQRILTWQYLSSDFLETNPITDIDLENLNRYLSETTPDRDAISPVDMQQVRLFLQQKQEKKLALKSITMNQR